MARQNIFRRIQVILFFLILIICISKANAFVRQEFTANNPFKAVNALKVGKYKEALPFTYKAKHGLPSDRVLSVLHTKNIFGKQLLVGTDKGLGRYLGGVWQKLRAIPATNITHMAQGDSSVLLLAGQELWSYEPVSSKFLGHLPSNVGNIYSLYNAGKVFIGTDSGLYRLKGKKFVQDRSSKKIIGKNPVYQITSNAQGDLALATAAGLYLKTSHSKKWILVHPEKQVKAVVFDGRGSLVMASESGLGFYQLSNGDWKWLTGENGLPYNRFKKAIRGISGELWFSTEIGAVGFNTDTNVWEYRQGRNWIANDSINDLATNERGDVYFATAEGLSVIRKRFNTLHRKAAIFNQAIDQIHKRTSLGYVLSVKLDQPGNRSSWKHFDSDNDGLWTSMYGASQVFAYASTGKKIFKDRADKAFKAVAFLSEVTQGGSKKVEPGFPARSILPIKGRNPNDEYTLQRDIDKQKNRDALWKVIHPRWPVSKDGKWYWKNDTSSDELDGHFFFYAQYFDLVAKTPTEKAEVVKVVRRIIDHLIRNDLKLKDWDGKPTRWANFSPKSLNGDRKWIEERGLNSLGILSYLKIAEHVTGDIKYKKLSDDLITNHGYLINAMSPKFRLSPETANHSDDEMAFMRFYSLLLYEKDPTLRGVYAYSFYNYFLNELPEGNPLFNTMYTAVAGGEIYKSNWGEDDLSPVGTWQSDIVETLKRFHIKRIQYGYKNSHRTDIEKMDSRTGRLKNGKVIPIDQRWIHHWNKSPYRLDSNAKGENLDDSTSFLLPYYMALYHGFIK